MPAGGCYGVRTRGQQSSCSLQRAAPAECSRQENVLQSASGAAACPHCRCVDGREVADLVLACSSIRQPACCCCFATPEQGWTLAGPSHPYTRDGIAAGMKNHRSGHVEDTHLSHFHFDDQYNTFHRCSVLRSGSCVAHAWRRTASSACLGPHCKLSLQEADRVLFALAAMAMPQRRRGRVSLVMQRAFRNGKVGIVLFD